MVTGKVHAQTQPPVESVILRTTITLNAHTDKAQAGTLVVVATDATLLSIPTAVLVSPGISLCLWI